MRAIDSPTAIRELMSHGMTPLEVRSGTGRQRQSAWFPTRRISKRQQQGLLHELGTLLGAGVSLAEALPTMVDSHEDGPLGPVLAQANQKARAGGALSDALDQPGLVWPAYVLPLLRAGEASGELSKALIDAADQMDQEISVSGELKNALVYPTVLVLAGLAAVLIIFIGVVPRFAGMLRAGKAEIPALSRWVIETGTFAHQNLLTVSLVGGGAVALIILLLMQPRVREWVLDLMADLPLIGSWLRAVDIGRWAVVLSALLANKVPFLEALRLSSGAIRLRSIRESLEQRGVSKVQQGQALSAVLEQETWFPHHRLSLVRVGERSGELAGMLRSLGLLESQAARNLQRRVLALIEPGAILVIGSVIGVIMVSVMMAITNLNTSVG